LALLEGTRFAGEAGGHRVDLHVPAEYGGGDGVQPMQLLLLALAGCTAMDVLSVLRKKRQAVSGLTVQICGYRSERRPKVYKRVEVLYRVRGRSVEEAAVERAVDLSRDRYCPVMAMVKGTAEIEMRYELEEEAPAGARREGG
jgi:putative redox protein